MRMSNLGVVVMTTLHSNSVRKRAVNLTLNENVVAQARALTPNLSAVVERLLSGYVAQAKCEQLSKQEQAKQLAGMWNGFNDRSGSFADEYSNL
jgi:antitoxin CcdA